MRKTWLQPGQETCMTCAIARSSAQTTMAGHALDTQPGMPVEQPQSAPPAPEKVPTLKSDSPSSSNALPITADPGLLQASAQAQTPAPEKPSRPLQPFPKLEERVRMPAEL